MKATLTTGSKRFFTPRRRPRKCDLNYWLDVSHSPWIATPLKKMGHAQKHLEDFRKLDPNLAEEDVASILEYVRKKGVPSAGEHGAKVFELNVEIGGKMVPVKVVESSSGVIKSGFPKN